ncbi:hypothetical protein HK104_004776, partial [Borealophlyctis nickersoniae]
MAAGDDDDDDEGSGGAGRDWHGGRGWQQQQQQQQHGAGTGGGRFTRGGQSVGAGWGDETQSHRGGGGGHDWEEGSGAVMNGINGSNDVDDDSNANWGTAHPHHHHHHHNPHHNPHHPYVGSRVVAVKQERDTLNGIFDHALASTGGNNNNNNNGGGGGAGSGTSVGVTAATLGAEAPWFSDILDGEQQHQQHQNNNNMFGYPNKGGAFFGGIRAPSMSSAVLTGTGAGAGTGTYAAGGHHTGGSSASGAGLNNRGSVGSAGGGARRRTLDDDWWAGEQHHHHYGRTENVTGFPHASSSGQHSHPAMSRSVPVPTMHPPHSSSSSSSSPSAYMPSAQRYGFATGGSEAPYYDMAQQQQQPQQHQMSSSSSLHRPSFEAIVPAHTAPAHSEATTTLTTTTARAVEKPRSHCRILWQHLFPASAEFRYLSPTGKLKSIIEAPIFVILSLTIPVIQREEMEFEDSRAKAKRDRRILESDLEEDVDAGETEALLAADEIDDEGDDGGEAVGGGGGGVRSTLCKETVVLQAFVAPLFVAFALGIIANEVVGLLESIGLILG